MDSHDPSFDPGTGATVVGTVHVVTLQSDGKILVGGSFSSYNSVTFNGLVRLNSDGSLDSAFNPGTGLSSAVYAIASEPGAVAMG